VGAWDSGVFANDAIYIWIDEYLVPSTDLSAFERAFAATEYAGEGYLDVDDACFALGAAEVLCWLAGRPGKGVSLPDRVATWVENHPQDVPPALLARAAESVDRVRTEPSELMSLWDGLDEWAQVVAELHTRLTS